jgi:hypothetical protein
MNNLTDFLVRRFLDEDVQEKRIIAIYPGRFQPFHAGHYHAYESLVKEFGKDNVFIVTSDGDGSSKSPFTFNDKSKMINSIFNIDLDHIIKSEHLGNDNRIQKSPYYTRDNTKNVLSDWMQKILHVTKTDPNNFGLVIGVGDKDFNDRVNNGAKPYIDKNDIENFNDGYARYFKLPQLQIHFNGDVISGQVIRNIIKTSPNILQIKNLLGQIFGERKVSDPIFNLIVNKIKKNKIKETLSEGKGFGFVKHVDDMKPDELLNFLKLWNQDGAQIIVNEKVDGQFFKWGLDNGKFFTEDVSKKYYSSTEYPEVYFYDEFRRYFNEISKIDFSSILKSLDTKDFNNFIVQSEAIPVPDHNIVQYDKEKIGDGVIVIFNITVDNKQADRKFINEFCNLANKHSKIKFHPNPIANVRHVKFDIKTINTLEGIIKKYGNVLSKPARTHEQKELKEKVTKAINLIGKQSKKKILDVPFPKAFGNETEGLIIYLPDGNIVKMVDKEKFTQRKDIFWKWIGELDTEIKRFKKEITSDPTNIKNKFDQLIKNTESIKNDFYNNGERLIGNKQSKKYQDTLKHISYVDTKLNKIKSLIDNGDVEGIKLIKEGGAAGAMRLDKTYKKLPTGKEAMAQKVPLIKIGRSAFVNEIKIMLEKLNSRVHLWSDFESVKSGLAFNGSSAHVFNTNEFSDDEIVKLKPHLNDIDLTIPKEKLDDLRKYFSSKDMDSLPDYEPTNGNKLSDRIHFVGFSRVGLPDQVVSIFAYYINPEEFVVFQIDFEGVEYVNGKPSEFAKFSRSSPIEDLKQNIKGVAHKFLLTAIARASSRLGKIAVISNTGKLSKKSEYDDASDLSFSVSDGLRKKFIPSGKTIVHPELGQVQAYRELTPTEARTKRSFKEGGYTKNLSEMFQMMFNKKPSDSDISKFSSFLGLLDLMKGSKNINAIFNEFVDLLYGKDSHEIEKGDMEADRRVKDSMMIKFYEQIPQIAKYQKEVDKLKNNYYKNFYK